jgi:hypothetical protein
MGAPTQPNPFAGLARSRKFWLLVLDTIIALVTYFVGKYARAETTDLLVLIGALQPIFVTIITLITVEDTAKTNADAKVQAASIVAVRPTPTPPSGNGSPTGI